VARALDAEQHRELVRLLAPDRVLVREIDRIAWADDASVYRLVPAAVVLPASTDDVRALFGFARAHRIPLTFRAAGTSLSGQAVTDGILAVVSRHWGAVEVLDGGRRVRVEPGVVGGAVNARLRPFGRKIGPDPASINACMMGGILANNSSGMCCGVEQNAYHTLDSIRFVLPDGLELDTADPGAERRLAQAAPALRQGLVELQHRVRSDPALCERIRRKYRLKNTMGYSLNAFLDWDRPLDVLAHLMIGSEGTLGFIAEAVLHTVPDWPLKYTGLLFFPGVPQACASIAALRDSGARALELMDRASLRAIEDRPGVPAAIRGLPPEAAALLVEYQCASADELEASRRACEALLPSLPLAAPASFTTDAVRQAALWRVRNGLVPSVGALRPRGTSFIMEDVVFPIERLATGVAELQSLFATHGYGDAIVFGHAKDGNLHFVLTQAFEDPREVARYDAFMRELAVLVVERHGGALKAEHGTGRNMAPFVAAEWGAAAHAVMVDLKRLVDPAGLLNPGVIVNDDPAAHVRHLKALPAVDVEIDPCIECGFCERHCPSRDLTLTPRQRIVVRREMARLAAVDPRSPALRELARDWRWDGLATCATDGLCATACPVAIDTGRLVKRLRRDTRSPAAQEIARLAAERFGLVEGAARLALAFARRAELPRAAALPRTRTARSGAAAVYFPSCVTRVVAPAQGAGAAVTLAHVVQEVAERAGVPVWIPPQPRGLCCGLPFASKGYERAARAALLRLSRALGSWTEGGRLPVLVDASPCAATLKHAGCELPAPDRERHGRLEILDPVEFAHDHWLPRAGGLRPRGTIVVHPVCSLVKADLTSKLLRVAGACSARAELPLAAGCCGFAGDRGFTVPGLTAAAMRLEAAEIAGGSYDGFYSTSRTCEIGLARATGKPWRSIFHLLDDATRC
jgi:D-lactate dehydrogenase